MPKSGILSGLCISCEMTAVRIVQIPGEVSVYCGVCLQAEDKYIMVKGRLIMANAGRKLGANISACMLEADISPESLARYLEYSIRDMWNVIEGKVIVPPFELEKIAGFLGTSKEELISREADNLVPNLQYMKEFTDADNLDRILDLMDEYVELREVI